MPYLAPQRKEQLDAGAPPLNAGDLAYLLTAVVLEYEDEGGHKGAFHAKVQDAVDLFLEFRPGRFQDFAEVLGACAATGREYRRRRRAAGVNPSIIIGVVRALNDWTTLFCDTALADYEDDKIAQNGDVYPA